MDGKPTYQELAILKPNSSLKKASVPALASKVKELPPGNSQQKDGFFLKLQAKMVFQQATKVA